MKCEVIRDLIPLYVDDCCSEESRTAVEAHVAACELCRRELEEIRSLSRAKAVPAQPPQAVKRVADFKASVLQSVLMFLSFIVLTSGVALEAYTPAGAYNGMWALALVIPAAGMLLSLANWYFVRQYPSKARFSVCSMLMTLVLILCGYGWSWVHYQIGIILADAPARYYILAGIGVALSIVFCVLSKLLSAKYAELLGKE